MIDEEEEEEEDTIRIACLDDGRKVCYQYLVPYEVPVDDDLQKMIHVKHIGSGIIDQINGSKVGSNKRYNFFIKCGERGD